eukprot:scaffold151504_cov22-Tisochrysis_lutea.AAC.1
MHAVNKICSPPASYVFATAYFLTARTGTYVPQVRSLNTADDGEGCGSFRLLPHGPNMHSPFFLHALHFIYKFVNHGSCTPF